MTQWYLDHDTIRDETDDRPIAEIWDVEQCHDEARLMVIAPDLLEACRRAEQAIRNLGNAFLTGDEQTIALNEALYLRTTIAKVTGQPR